MDRKSKQKIRYILWILLVFVVVILFSICCVTYVNKIRERQLQELIVIYPEVKTQLEDNFNYYKNRLTDFKFIVITAALLMILAFAYLLLLINKKNKRKTIAEYDKELNLIYEQLMRFQKGDFEILPSLKDSSDHRNIEGILEKLQELGYYFTDLKLRLAEEENRTKA